MAVRLPLSVQEREGPFKDARKILCLAALRNAWPVSSWASERSKVPRTEQEMCFWQKIQIRRFQEERGLIVLTLWPVPNTEDAVALRWRAQLPVGRVVTCCDGWWLYCEHCQPRRHAGLVRRGLLTAYLDEIPQKLGPSPCPSPGMTG